MRTAVVAVGTAAVVLSGCGSDSGSRLPAVAVTAVPNESVAACERMHEALPKDLGKDLPRRATTPDDVHVAAYGEPAVVIRCGAPRSATYVDQQLIDINGVDWFPEERGEVVVWSTPKAFVNVEVTVPRAWQGDRLAHLSDAVKKAG